MVDPSSSNMTPIPTTSLLDDNSNHEEIITDFAFQVDQFLLTALANPRDRLMILKLDQDLEKFITDSSKKKRLVYPPMTSYQRLIVHRVAAYFGLDHVVVEGDSGKRSVVIFKSEQAKVPLIRLRDLVEQQENTSAPPSIKIMKKEKHNSSNQNSHKSHSNHSENDADKTYEKREEEYARARARIFGDENTNAVNNSEENNVNGVPSLVNKPTVNNVEEVSPRPNTGNAGNSNLASANANVAPSKPKSPPIRQTSPRYTQRPDTTFDMNNSMYRMQLNTGMESDWTAPVSGWNWPSGNPVPRPIYYPFEPNSFQHPYPVAQKVDPSNPSHSYLRNKGTRNVTVRIACGLIDLIMLQNPNDPNFPPLEHEGTPVPYIPQSVVTAPVVYAYPNEEMWAFYNNAYRNFGYPISGVTADIGTKPKGSYSHNEYERRPPKSTVLFDPNAPLERSNEVPRNTNENFGNATSPHAIPHSHKLKNYVQSDKNPELEGKQKTEGENVKLAGSKEMDHILEITIAEKSRATSGVEDFLQQLQNTATIKWIDKSCTRGIAIFKTSSMAKVALEKVPCEGCNLSPWKINLTSLVVQQASSTEREGSSK